MKQALILLSGGVDSLCCAHFLQTQGFNLNLLFVDYGQAALEQERQAAKRVALHFKAALNEIKFRANAGYAEGELIGRNLFLYAAAIFSNTIDNGIVSSGVHSGTQYFDCSKSFHQELSILVANMTDGKIEFFAPFLSWSKVEVYKYALENNLPLGLTYSCESDSTLPCGECLSCQDRSMLQDLQRSAN